MLQEEHSAILSTFINLPFVIKICVLPIFEWPFYTGFTVSRNGVDHYHTQQNVASDQSVYFILNLGITLFLNNMNTKCTCAEYVLL